MKSNVFIIGFTIAGLISCKKTTLLNLEKKELLASVFDFKLYKSDADSLLKGRFNANDSALVYSNFVNTWIKEKILLHEASQILTKQEQDKSALVSQYYNDLLIFELQEKWLSQKLDTIVTDEAIAAYYEKNSRNFQLKENIVRLRFFSIPNNYDKLNLLWQKFVEGGEENLKIVERVNKTIGGNHFYNDTLWLSFDDVLKEVPIVTYNQESFLSNNRYIQQRHEGLTYFVEILDFKIKNSISPLEFEKARIKNILLHKRKIEILKQIEDEIVNKAYTENKIKTF
ncbi:MAG: hypothetical protein H6607_07350 [Flavobacteriales bacterium]|nr:hypothetical protein [Flavobacteriales bacterium]